MKEDKGKEGKRAGGWAERARGRMRARMKVRLRGNEGS